MILRHRRRPWPCALGLAVAIGVCWSPAAAPGAGIFRPTVFKFSGTEKSYRVPSGVTMLGIDAIGGFGSPNPLTVDNGMDLGVALPVTPGEALYVEVGRGATGPAATFGGGGAGGAGNAPGGAGGGASDVRTCSAKAAHCTGGGTSLASRLVVAAGGGGSGGTEDPKFNYTSTCGSSDGGGSAAGGGSPAPVKVARGTVIPGQNGILVGAGAGGSATTPGGGGSRPASCSGGIGPRIFGDGGSGHAGAGAQGGSGAASGASPTPGGGGGGGGGYFGGGGGSSGQADLPSPGCQPGGCEASSGSGGGAGSSFYAAAATGNIFYESASGDAPAVTLTPLIDVTRPAGGAVFNRGQVVDAAYACLDTCSGTVPSGHAIDTATPGRHSFEVTDQAQSHDPAVSTLHYTVR